MNLNYLKSQLIQNHNSKDLWSLLAKTESDYLHEKYIYYDQLLEDLLEVIQTNDLNEVNKLLQDVAEIKDFQPVEVRQFQFIAFFGFRNFDEARRLATDIQDLQARAESNASCIARIDFLSLIKLAILENKPPLYLINAILLPKLVASFKLPGSAQLTKELVDSAIARFHLQCASDPDVEQKHSITGLSYSYASMALECVENDILGTFYADYFILRGMRDLPIEKPNRINPYRPVVSIIIPVYNKCLMTKICIDSLVEISDEVPFEIIIADDCSSDETFNFFSRYNWLRLIRTSSNKGFIGNCNHAAHDAKGDYILFLNNDTIVHERFLTGILQVFNSDPSAAIVGSLVENIDHSVQESGGILWPHRQIWNFGRDYTEDHLFMVNYTRKVDYVSGCSLAIKKSVWKALGGFDPLYSPAYCEDTDICIKVRQLGHSVYVAPASKITHLEGMSNSKSINSGIKEYQSANIQKLYDRWGDYIAMNAVTGDEKQVFIASRDVRSMKGTVLFIDHYVPTTDKDAGSKSAFSILQALREMNYNIVFLPENHARIEPYTSTLEELGICVLYGNYIANNLYSFLESNLPHVDIVFLCRPHISVRYLTRLKEIYPDSLFLYYMHDLHGLRKFLSENPNVDSEQFEGDLNVLCNADELAIMPFVDAALTPSLRELDLLKKHFAHIYQIPLLAFDALAYQVNIDDKVNHVENENPNMIIRGYFVGGFNHQPNIVSMEWFLKNVMPILPDFFKLDVVGSSCPNSLKELMEISPSVTYHETLSDEQLSGLLINSSICIAPLLYGAGVKGKTLEAFYHGNVVLGSKYAVEGIPQVPDSCFKLCVTPEDYNSAIQRLALMDEATLEAASRAAHHYATDNFSISQITSCLASIIKCFPKVHRTMTASLNIKSNASVRQPTYGIYHDNWLARYNGISLALNPASISIKISLYLPEENAGYIVTGDRAISLRLFALSGKCYSTSHCLAEGMNVIEVRLSELDSWADEESSDLLLRIDSHYSLRLPSADSREIFIVFVELEIVE